MAIKWFTQSAGQVNTTIPAIILLQFSKLAGQVNTLDRGGIAIVSSIPKGLPGFTGDLWFPMVDPGFSDLFIPAIVIMAVDLLESTSIAR